MDLRSTGGNSASVQTPQLTSVCSDSHWCSAWLIRKDDDHRCMVDADDGDDDDDEANDDDDDCRGDNELATGQTRI